MGVESQCLRQSLHASMGILNNHKLKTRSQIPRDVMEMILDISEEIVHVCEGCIQNVTQKCDQDLPLPRVIRFSHLEEDVRTLSHLEKVMLSYQLALHDMQDLQKSAQENNIPWQENNHKATQKSNANYKETDNKPTQDNHKKSTQGSNLKIRFGQNDQDIKIEFIDSGDEKHEADVNSDCTDDTNTSVNDDDAHIKSESWFSKVKVEPTDHDPSWISSFCSKGYDDDSLEGVMEHTNDSETSYTHAGTSDEKGIPKRYAGKTPLFCDACPRKYYYKSELKNHYERAHLGINLFCCDECDKKFETKTGLIRHKAQHTGDHKYKCEHCGMGFSYKPPYLEHLQRHFNIKPHVCLKCGKAFTRKPDYSFHMQICGVKKRTVECEICQKKFKAKKYLMAHLAIHKEEGNKYQCKLCDKSYSQSASLSRHRLKFHPKMENSVTENS